MTKSDDAPVPPNVTLQRSTSTPPRIPDNLLATSSQLADLVDFHDADFSGSWFQAPNSTLHIGVATPAGGALLAKRGLINNAHVVVETADRSLAEGQQFAADYLRHSRLQESLVGWGILPQGDGIELFVHGEHLSPDQLSELGALPVRVVVILGQNGETLT